ncbi:ankyrin repeat domain-containing protein [Winogradskyella arenosi]|uniref:Ankyrin repeat protein n=1 Tax=Winogradskyella arenosi TaxID=533325 RepID=A0A368ZGQ9_9FLAO|nr:ankyrin repeat domain-containing protein [Winogradskyella arenosi]RCW92694.1 ankyrin repeat protein [Winogradskyella arenosi]
MKILKPLIIVLVLVLALPTHAQKKKENILLNRDFWGTQPSIALVKAKIKEGNNPSEANKGNFDPVVYAILQDAPTATINYLLTQKGNDVNKLTHDGRTYLFWAAYKGNSTMVEQLLRLGAKTDLTDDKGSTVIHFAASAGQQNIEVYELILKENSELVHRTNPDGANALLLAAPSDPDFKLTSYFLSKGLSIKSTDNDGNGIFNYAVKKGQIDLLKMLVDKGLTGTDQAFIMAANGARGTTNGVEVYTFLESVGLNPKVIDKEGVSPLHIVAARGKDLKVIEYLMGKGLEVSTPDHKGNTAFMNAAENNNLELVKTLAQHLNAVNMTNKKGQSALTLAVAGNSPEVVAYLIDKGFKTDIVDVDGNNLVAYAIGSYSARNKAAFSKKLEILKSNSADVTAVQKNGNTWFHLAVEQNSLDLLKLAVDMNQDINAKNSEGNTALHIAALKAKDTTILKFLVDQGAKKNLVTDFEETAYDLAKENELLSDRNISIEFLK